MSDYDHLIHSMQNQEKILIEGRKYAGGANADFGFYSLWLPDLPNILQTLTEGSVVMDVGCGTGNAAAGMAQFAPNLDIYGCTLSYYPPVAGSNYLLKDRIYICPARDIPKQFDLAVSIGALEVSGTVLEDGPILLDLLNPGGIAMFAPTVPTDAAISSFNTLLQIGRRSGFASTMSITKNILILFTLL